MTHGFNLKMIAVRKYSIKIGSVYGIITSIWLVFMVNVGKYIYRCIIYSGNVHSNKNTKHISPCTTKTLKLATMMSQEVFLKVRISGSQPQHIGGGFKGFLFSARKFGKSSNLTSIFLNWVGSTTN